MIPQVNRSVINNQCSSIDHLVFEKNTQFQDIIETCFENTGIKYFYSDNIPNVIIKFVEMGAESYKMDIFVNSISIQGSSAGILYALQTLVQILIDKKVSTMTIEDSPRFVHRGLMLDVSRHFFGVSTIKKILDIMARVKLNTFHWHLSDDQGWRIDLANFPELTSRGATRTKTLIGGLKAHIIKRYDDSKYSGYYSRDEIREIIEYAEKRHITIIPEIDLPGHSSAILAAYPQLGCGSKKYDVQADFGIFDAVLCAGRESTYEFLSSLFKDIADLFPGEYIHLGGDEVRNRNWKACPDCLNRINSEGIDGLEGLKNYFINRVSKIIVDSGRIPIGWNEVLDEGLNENVIFQHWMGGGKKVKKQLENGRRAIISRFFYLYLDYNYHFTPMRKTYNLNPIPDDLGDEYEKNVLGVEATLWTEWVRDETRLFYQLLPRLYAVAEVGWTNQANKSYARFNDDLEVLNKLVGVSGPKDPMTFDPPWWRRILLWNAFREPKY